MNVGVEWDKENRGKHDGSCVDAQGTTHQHFNCAAGAGSFVKPTKIRTGCTFVEALMERYVSMDAPMITGQENSLTESFAVTAKGERKVIEFVGESNIRKHQQLADVVDVSVRNCAVSSAGDGLAELAGHVTSADVQDNLFSSWTDVTNIVKCLPRLKTLLLHGNKIGDIDLDAVASFQGHFDELRVMALNRCGLSSWATVSALHTLLPQITELYLAANPLGRDIAPLPAAAFPHVTVIDLSSCDVASWVAVKEACGALPSLQALVLDCNAIDNISPNDEEMFSNLTRVSLASTRLSSWSDVNAIATYPKLTSLRLTHIPLFSGKGASEVRPEVIARVAQLLVFNGSNVTARERMDSEKIYLRKMLRQKRIIEGEEAEEQSLAMFHNMNPRFNELNELYGADLLPMGGEGPSSGLSSMASDMVAVTLHNLSFASNGSLEPVSRKLPASLKVERLRLMVKQLFGLEAHKQLLSIRTYKGAVPTLMDEDEATIGYFGAIDGADIFINEAKE